MTGFTDILGALVQNGMSKSGSSRVTNAFGAGGGGGLEDIIGSIGGMLGGAGQSGQAGIGGMLGDVMNSLGNNKAALGGLGALAGAMLGRSDKTARGAVGGGALAMLASLAFSALKNAGKAPAQPPRSLFAAETPQQRQELEEDANVIVKAMINAAKADGSIDTAELEKIVGKFEEDGLTRDEKDFFISETAKPLDLRGVIASAGGRPDMAAQIYAASLLAIEVDTLEEQQYMRHLADGLDLDAGTVSYIEQTLGVR